MEFLLFEALVFCGIEAVELGGAAGAGGFRFQGDEEIQFGDPFAEVSLVELGAENRFAEVLDLAEGDLFGSSSKPTGCQRSLPRSRARAASKMVLWSKASGGGAETGNHWASAASVAARVCMSVSFTSA